MRNPLAHGIMDLRGQVRINSSDCVAKACQQDRLLVVGPFRVRAINSNLWSVGILVAQIQEPIDGGLFDCGFGERCHGGTCPKDNYIRWSGEQ